MIRKIFLTVAATLVAVTGLFAQELPDDPEVRKGVLDNGMTYYIRHNNKPANQAEFWIFDNVGALQEEDSQQGLAHFLEHMAFNVVADPVVGYFYKTYVLGVPQDAAATWAKIGAVTTLVNAVVAVVVASAFYLALRPALEHAGLLKKAV